MYYILDENNNPKKAELLEWAKWSGQVDVRKIKFDSFENGTGKINVSTVFLGLDHNFDDNGPPLVFETMIFGGIHDQYQDRYSTIEEALAGHETAVQLVQNKSEE